MDKMMKRRTGLQAVRCQPKNQTKDDKYLAKYMPDEVLAIVRPGVILTTDKNVAKNNQCNLKSSMTLLVQKDNYAAELFSVNCVRRRVHIQYFKVTLGRSN